MRGLECKRLRKLAREASVGKLLRGLLGKPYAKSSIGKDGKPILRTPTMAINDPNTTRGMYRILKKNRAATFQMRSKDNG